jgi:hypothetical protein
VSDSPEETRVPKRRFDWLRAAGDRVPTKWFAGIFIALFLAATAAFGGLATAAPPEIDRLEPGEAHITDQRSLTIQRAVLIDELPEAGVYPEPGQRVFALVADVENRWDRPASVTSRDAIRGSFSVDGIEPETTMQAARLEDESSVIALQPGVSTKIVFAWAVDADQFTGGERVDVALNDMSLYTGSFVIEGQSWDSPVTTAAVTVEIEDVGAGAE